MHLGSAVSVPLLPSKSSTATHAGATEGPAGTSDLFLTCRTKHISGSPRHKGLKKTHFIKNMRQYDTKNSRYRRGHQHEAAGRVLPPTWRGPAS